MGFKSKPTFRRTHRSDVFGHIPNVPVNSTFENRLFLHHSSVHSGIMAGIAGSKHEGCYSVVLSGGYEDDKDQGYTFTYTGCGGRDTKDGEKPREGPQTCDQSWDNARNASLRVSAHTKKPVRVVRGYNSSSDFAPAVGYRYDGLYVVEKAWMDVGKSGYKVCKFTFRRLPDQPPIPRRQGTLHLDLSEWEQPKHFGRNYHGSDADTDNASDNDSDSTTRSPPRKKRILGKGKASGVLLTRTGVPLIRRPKHSDSEHDESDDPSSSRRSRPHQSSSRSRSENPPPRRAVPPLKPLLPPSIPPTTNVMTAERRALPVAKPQVPSQAPQPDVHALLAEWNGSALKLGASAPPAQKTEVQRPCPRSEYTRLTG